MPKSSINLDRQADARIFPFGTVSSGGDALVTINKGALATSAVVLDVKGSTNIGGDLNLIGNLNITGAINETSTTNLVVADINITLNRGGTTASAAGGGILIEGDTATVVGAIKFDNTLASKFSIGNGTTQIQIVDISSIQTLTNKSISGSQITSTVANATLAATVTTNANLSGPIASVGNTTSITSQTGTGTTFVMNTSPTLITPVLGAATATSINTSGSQTTGVASAADGNMVWQNAVNAFTQSFRGSNPGASIVYVLPTTAPTAGQVLTSTAPAAGTATMSWASGSTGTVTSVSVTTANGVSGSVATATTTPAITLTLGAITPTSVAATGTVSGSNLSGTNTGDQTLPVGTTPSALVGITAIAGVASSFIRSDGAPALSQAIVPTWTGIHTHSQNSIASTSTDAVVISNITAATVGAQQFSPRERFVAQGWKTNATAGSQQVEWFMENRPIQGTISPSTNFAFASVINGGAAVDQFILKSDGSGTFTGALTASNLSGTNTGDQTSVSGNAGSATLTAITDDTTTNATEFITWVTTASGNQSQKVSSTKLTFNPSTGTLSSVSFAGAGTGLTGTAASLTAGTVTTNANLTGSVTSTGNVTTVITNANLSGDVTSVGNTTTFAKYQKRCVTTGTQDGTNKVFTIGSAIKSSSDVVSVNGQILNPGSSNDYVYDGSVTITFQAAFTAPASTDTIQIFGVY